MYNLRYQTKFRRDVRQLAKRGYDLTLLEKVIDLLQIGEPLPRQYRDHPLAGNWAHYRECHIQADWLLIYKIEQDDLILILARTGTHADLLEK